MRRFRLQLIPDVRRTKMPRQREITTLRDLTWHLPAVLAGVAIVISIALAVVFGVTQPMLLFTIVGATYAILFLAMLVAVGLVALNDPWVWDRVERASNRLIGFVFRFPAVSTGEEGLIGSRGVVTEDLGSSESGVAKGRVRVAGESWAAVASSSATKLEIGQEVIVRGLRGLTLVVEASPRGNL